MGRADDVRPGAVDRGGGHGGVPGAEGLPPEEGTETADVSKRVGEDPEKVPNATAPGAVPDTDVTQSDPPPAGEPPD